MIPRDYPFIAVEEGNCRRGQVLVLSGSLKVVVTTIIVSTMLFLLQLDRGAFAFATTKGTTHR